MNTKTILLTHIHLAKLDCGRCLDELLDMMSRAVMRTDVEEINWHLMNDLADADILLIIVLTDLELTINFNDSVLREAVKYVMASNREVQH